MQIWVLISRLCGRPYLSYANGQIYLIELGCYMISFGGFLAECLPCSAQYRSLKENSDNWAQKLWGGHRRQSWETRNGGIQSKIIRILLENTPSFAKLNPKSFAIKSQVKTSKSCILIIYPLVLPDWIGWRPIIQEIIRAGKDWSRKCGEERKMNVAQIWKMLKTDGERSDE